jgi:hypothetical protein
MVQLVAALWLSCAGSVQFQRGQANGTSGGATGTDALGHR